MTDFTSRLPKDLYRASQVQQLDRVAIDELGIPGFQLMQTAGAVAFSALLERWPQVRRLMIFVGGGNNGGDGYIVAGLAQEQGLSIELIQIGDAEKLSGDAARARDWALEKNVSAMSLQDLPANHDNEASEQPHTVIVDALLGTGLDRPVAGDYQIAIDLINSSSNPVLSVDIPSGLSADTGMSLGCTVVADLTVTFIGMKQGLLTGQGRDYVGTVLFNSLDVPQEVYSSTSSPMPAAQKIDINSATQHLLPRASSSHKGVHGHVVVMGGDYGFGGAGIMAAEAAQRAGAGLVSLVTRSAHRPAALSRRPEIMVLGTEDEHAAIEQLLSRADVIAIGPGLGQSEWSNRLLQMALATQLARDIPLVVDADALHLLADRNQGGTSLRRDNWILTPHPGEAASLLNCSVAVVQQDRFAAITQLQSQWGGCCLLKGSGSLICSAQPEQKVYLCTEGNPGMASGGMGDVLTGLTAGLLAQGLTLEQSLCSAACIHGEAADLAMAAGGQRGMLATDLFPYIRQLVNPTL